MKKNQEIRSLSTISKANYLKKPFGFCCDINHPDFDTQYNVRNPPFESAFPETSLIDSRPDVKFRVQDVAKSSVIHRPTERGGIFPEDSELDRSALYGKRIKGRGSLKWFLEDEILVAQEILSQERKAKYDEKIKLEKIAAKNKGNKKKKKLRKI